MLTWCAYSVCMEKIKMYIFHLSFPTVISISILAESMHTERPFQVSVIFQGVNLVCFESFPESFLVLLLWLLSYQKSSPLSTRTFYSKLLVRLPIADAAVQLIFQGK
jgi:hypothetical protein